MDCRVKPGNDNWEIRSLVLEPGRRGTHGLRRGAIVSEKFSIVRGAETAAAARSNRTALGTRGEPPLVSVVAPVYNEEKALPELIERLAQVAEQLASEYRFEFLLVDDGSRDRSLAVAHGLLEQESRLRVLELRRNYGQTAALQAGLDHAKGAIVISMDADLQHFQEDIPLLLETLAKGFDLVCGWRHKRDEGIIRRWPSRVANRLIRQLSGVEVHDVGTTFRAYRAEILRDFRLIGEHHRFVPVFAQIAGARITEVKIRNIGRPAGKSSYGLGRTLSVLMDIFFVTFYVHFLDRPIRLFGTLSLMLFVAALAITLWLAYLFLVHEIPVVRDHSGLFILGLVLYVGSLQLILFGIMSEILVRLFYQSGSNTVYSIREERTGASNPAGSRNPSGT